MLLLVVAMLAIAAAIVVPTIAFEIRRDREEELIHRGVEYSRAIQRFTRLNGGRYPSRLEELSNGDLKCIRKLYKDPITGGNFRLLHMSDISSATGTRVASEPGSQGSTSQVAGTSENTATAVDSNSDATNPGSIGTAAGTAAAAPSPAPNQAVSGGNPVVGGIGPIIGVASWSKARSIREFWGKNHYNDWLFFYSPGYTRLRITGPTSLTPLPPPSLSGASANQSQPQGVQETAPGSGQNPPPTN